jgi:hypothetical protein
MNTIALWDAIEAAEAKGFLYYAAVLRGMLARELHAKAHGHHRLSYSVSSFTGDVQSYEWPARRILAT